MAQYELNLRDYVRIFYKRKFVILASFVAVMLGSYYYLSHQPQVYEATSTVKVEERRTVAGLLTEWIVYSPADIMESQAKIIKSFSIMKKAARQLGMIDENATDEQIHRAVTQVQGSIISERVPNANIIRITASADRPKQAMLLANTVAEAYVEENLLEKTKQARAARKFIQEQLVSLETRLLIAEERLKEMESEAGDVRLSGPIQDRLIEMEFELAGLLQRYTEEHPQVKQVKEQIKDLEAQLQGFSGRDLEYARLAREVEVNKKLYAMLKEKLEEARITEAQKISDISIVNPAVMPTSPVGLQKTLGLLIGGMMGIILGIALAFMFESLDTSIGTIEDVENVVKLPVLGVIPSIHGGSKTEKGSLGKLKRGLFRVKQTEAQEKYVRLIVHHQPKSPVSEAYRNIRTNLKLDTSKKTVLITSAGPREGKTTVLINLGLTFAQKGAKTLLVSSDLRRPALARTFGVRRTPGLNEVLLEMLDLDQVLRSVSDIVLGDMELKEIRKTPGMEYIWILPSGHPPTNPAEILESDKVNNLITELKRRFDVILFDSPPVLPITDASLLASRLDCAVLVYEIGRTARSALLRAKIQLEKMNAKISGVVLNHIRPQTENVPAYPYYYYRYRYYGAEPSQRESSEKEQGSEEEYS